MSFRIRGTYPTCSCIGSRNGKSKVSYSSGMPKLSCPCHHLPSSAHIDFPCRKPDHSRYRSPQSRAWRTCTKESSPWGKSVVLACWLSYINTYVHPSFISFHHRQSLLSSNSRHHSLHRALDPIYTSQCLSPSDGLKARLVPFGPPSLSVHSLLSAVFSLVRARQHSIQHSRTTLTHLFYRLRYGTNESHLEIV